MKNNMKKGGLGKFLCGAAVGAGLGLLFAPKTGKETRADLKKKFDEVLEQVKSIKAEDVKESIVKKVNELQKEYTSPDKGIIIKKFGDNYKLTTKKEHKYFYEKYVEKDSVKTLSQSALETLAI